MVLKFVKKIFSIIYHSYLSAHFVVIICSVILSMMYFSEKRDISNSDYLGILNTSGLLSAFFILALDKIEFKRIKQGFQKMEPVGLSLFGKRTEITQGNKMTNTMFSFFVNSMLLICTQYILYIFESFYKLIYIIT